MTMLSEVGQYIADNFAQWNLATTLFLGQMPEAPDRAMALHQGPGRPDFTLGATDGDPHHPNFEHFRLQIAVRAAGVNAYPDAEADIWAVYRKLNLANVTIGTVRYLSITPVDIPAPLEVDKKDRVTFVCNFDIQREPESESTQ